MAAKRIKYLINLTKEMKHLYTKNYQTLITEIAKNTAKQEDIQCTWTVKINII